MTNKSELAIFKQFTVSTLKGCKTQASLTPSIQLIVQKLGYTNFDLTYFGDNNIVDVFAHTIPESLIETYFTENLHTDDLTNQYISNADTPTFLSELYNFFGQCKNKNMTKMKHLNTTLAVHDLMKSHGFHNTFSCPASSNKKSSIYLSLHSKGVPENEFISATKNNRLKISFLVHAINNQLPINHLADSKLSGGLSAKQIEIIRLMCKYSFSQKQCASQLELTKKTVETYCSRIKEKLGKDSMIGACYEAIRLGIITVDN